MKIRTNIKVKKIDIFIFNFVFVCILTFILLRTFTVKSEKYLKIYTINQAYNIANALINKSVMEEILTEKSDVSNILITKKDDDEEIIGIDFNMPVINKHLYNITEKITKDLNNLEKSYLRELNIVGFDNKKNIYYVSMGIIYGMPALTFLAPKIPFKINMIGNIESYLQTKITEYGINNSLVELFINIKLNLTVVYPFITETVCVEKQIPFESKIIKGQIPYYYGGVIKSNTPNLNNTIY